MESLREDILAIVDEHSGGAKGLEIMAALMMKRGREEINPDTFYDQIEEFILAEIPELGFLRYGHLIDDQILREKVFVYRKIDC